MKMSRSLLQKLLGCSLSLGLLILLSMVSFLDAQAITKISPPDEALPEELTEDFSVSTLPFSSERKFQYLTFMDRLSEHQSPPVKTPFLPKQDTDVNTLKIPVTTDTLTEVEVTSNLPDIFEHHVPVWGLGALNDISVEEPTNHPSSAVKSRLTSSDTTATMVRSTLASRSTTATVVKSTLASSNTIPTMVRSTLASRSTTATIVKSTLASSNTTTTMVRSTLASGKTTVMESSPELHPRGKPGQSTKGKDKTTVHTPRDTKLFISSSGPGFWSTTMMTPTVAEGSDPSTRGNPTSTSTSTHTVKIIVATVISLLLLFILFLLFVYCRRRHRSGSTSFSEAQWAGQARVPDDSGLEKEVEQGRVIPGAGEVDSRHDTLVTFVGKRQSRVPSVAMEEIAKKGDGAENQKLLGGPADTGSGPEGDGELNGKLLEPFEQSSQETLPPLGPASQDS